MTNLERVRRYRSGLRAAGYRPVQVWVRDTRRPDFIEACRRQCLALKDDPQEAAIQAWIDEAADPSGWE